MDLTQARWRKSTFSNTDGGNNCVEIAHLSDGTVALRDSKNPTATPHRYSPAAWSHFLTALRTNTL